MPLAKIGLQTRSLRQPLRQALQTAARLGADGVEIDLRGELPVGELSQTAIRELRKITGNLGLRVASVAFPTRRGYDDPGDLDRRLQATERAMTAAYHLGARVLVNRLVATVPEDESPRRQTLLESLEVLSAAGNRTGVRLAAESVGEPIRLASLLNELPRGTLGVSLDPAQLLAEGYEPIEAVDTYGELVLDVRATDAVRDLSERRTVTVELGRGAADLPALCASLEAHDYEGWITVSRRDSANPVEELGNAVAFLKSL